MSVRSWFRTNRRQVIAHTSIILGFVLLTAFVVGPLFDKLEQFAGVSQLCATSVPTATDNIHYEIDHFEAAEQILVIHGWAFIEGRDSLNSKIYIVLKSAERTYIFTTETVMRESITGQFEELGLNLDYSGFSALVPTRDIASGEYSVGICVRKDDIEALIYTSEAITKSGHTVRTERELKKMRGREPTEVQRLAARLSFSSN
jgi:hypothetical protein